MVVYWRCLLHVCCIACCFRSLSCPLIEAPFLSSHILHWKDHGDLLRERRLMLHTISSQISILVAGLQRLEGQQRHLQPPPPPPAPDGQSPLPPPPTSAPPSVPATSVRPTYPTVPITLVATSDNRMEPAGHVNPVSVSLPENADGVGHAAAATTGVLLAALPTLVPRLTIALSCQSPHRQSRPRRRVPSGLSYDR